MNLSRAVIASVCLLALAACSSKAPPPPCPQVAIVRALERYEDFGQDTPDKSNLVAVARMDSIEGTCRYEDEGVYVEFDLAMRAVKGPRLGGDKASFPFFVAIVDGSDRLIRKNILTAPFSFEDGPQARRVEALDVFIPAVNGVLPENHRVLAGFQLSESQLGLARKSKD